MNPVTIKVDLNATSAYAEIAELETLLGSLGVDIGNLDFDDTNLSQLVDDIGEMVKGMGDAEESWRNLRREMEEAASVLDGMDVNIPDNLTGGSEGNGANTKGPPSPSKTVETVKEAVTDGGDGSDNSGFDPSVLGKYFGQSHLNFSELQGTTDDGAYRDMVSGFWNKFHHGKQFNLKGTSLPSDISQYTKASSYVHDGAYGLEPASMFIRRITQGGDLDFSSGMRASKHYPKASLPKHIISRFRKLGNESDSLFPKLNDGMEGFEGRIKSMMPTMQKWWQLIALLLPLLIAVGVQALGVAAAFGAVAIAGAGLIGLGLIGHAKSMGGAFAQAKKELHDFKRELFQTFQPTAQLFAPIESQFLASAPDDLQQVATSMRGLTKYSRTMNREWAALTGGIAEFFNILTRNEEKVSQLTDRFGGLLGSGILNFFEWLLQAASKNQDMLVNLGVIIIKVAAIIYNLAMAVGKMAQTFMPLVNIVLFLSNILSSDFIVGIITAIAWLYILGAVLDSTVFSAFMKAIVGIWDFSASVAEAIGLTLGLVGAIGLLTMGLSLIGGGIAMATMGDAGFGDGGPPGGGGGGGGGGYYPGGGSGGQVINNYTSNYELTNYGEMSSDSEQRFRTQFSRMSGEKSAMQAPEVQGATSSQTDKSL